MLADKYEFTDLALWRSFSWLFGFLASLQPAALVLLLCEDTRACPHFVPTKLMMQVGERVCRQGNDSVVGEVVCVAVRVKFPDGTRSFTPGDLHAAPACRPVAALGRKRKSDDVVIDLTPGDLLAAPECRLVAAPGRKHKSYDVVIDYCHDTDFGGNQVEIGSLNKRFNSMDAAVSMVDTHLLV